MVKPQALKVRLVLPIEATAQTEDPSINHPAALALPTTTIMLPWTAPGFAAVKGIIHAQSANPAMKAESRGALLTGNRQGRGLDRRYQARSHRDDLRDCNARAIAAEQCSAACAACHGPDATGSGQIPRLAGQLYPYVIKELTNWSKERGQNPTKPDTSAIMSPVAHSLSKPQIEAVAAAPRSSGGIAPLKC